MLYTLWLHVRVESGSGCRPVKSREYKTEFVCCGFTLRKQTTYVQSCQQHCNPANQNNTTSSRLPCTSNGIWPEAAWEPLLTCVNKAGVMFTWFLTFMTSCGELCTISVNNNNNTTHAFQSARCRIRVILRTFVGPTSYKTGLGHRPLAIATADCGRRHAGSRTRGSGDRNAHDKLAINPSMFDSRTKRRPALKCQNDGCTAKMRHFLFDSYCFEGTKESKNILDMRFCRRKTMLGNLAHAIKVTAKRF